MVVRNALEFLIAREVGVELLYSFVIIVCSLMIFRATKEMYELSSHKGLKYFRQAFLFFAVAYFFKYFIAFFLYAFEIREILDISPRLIGWFTLFVFIYSSSMAVFSILYSVVCKKMIHKKRNIILLNLLALGLAFAGSLIRMLEITLGINLILFAVSLFILTLAYRESEHKERGKTLYLIYLLLSIFWILNVIDVLLPRFLELYQLIIYLTSTFLFMIILYKVLKKVGD